LLPTPQEESLLEAALAGPPKADAAFSTWLSGIDLSAEISWEVVRLLPLAFHNLRAQGVDAPVLGRFKGVLRRTWYQSQRVMSSTRPSLGCLRAAGIDPLVLDDAALALGCYESAALRPVTRLDLLVGRSEVGSAVDALRRDGWRSRSDGTADDLRFADHISLLGSENAEVRLRWAVLPGDPDPAAARPAAAPLVWLGSIEGGLNPTSQLLRILLRRHHPDDAPSFHWVPDALMVLRKNSSGIEWSGLLATAAAHRLTGLLAQGLGYLSERFGAAIPSGVLTSLARHRATFMERLADTVVVTYASRTPSSPEPLRVEFFRYLERTRRVGNPIRTLIDFSHSLRYRWKLPGRREILPALFRRWGGSSLHFQP
jgi:hypothetical protein